MELITRLASKILTAAPRYGTSLSISRTDMVRLTWRFFSRAPSTYGSSGASDDTPSSPSHHFNAETVAAMKFLRNGQLPSPTMGAIEEVGRALKAISRSPSVKERLCELFIQQVRSTPKGPEAVACLLHLSLSIYLTLASHVRTTSSNSSAS